MIYTADDAIFLALTAPGGLFELEGSGTGARFKGHPETLIALYRRARLNDDAIMTSVGGETASFAAVFARAAALSRPLAGRFGVTIGTPVAIVMGNRLEWMISFIAVTALGGVAVLVNSRGAPEELHDAVSRAGCGLVLADGERAASLAATVAEPPWRQIILAEGAKFVRDGRDAIFEEVSRAGGAAEFRFAELDGAAPAAVLFTSGTTGHPKGAIQSHRALTHAIGLAGLAGTAADLRYARELGRSIPPERTSNRSPTIVAGPLFHLGGIIPFLRCLHYGTKTLFPGKWHPETVLRLIKHEGATRLSLVPTMLWDLLRSPEATPDTIGRILFVSSGAAAISPALTREIAARTPGCMLGNTYGSTETCGYIATLWGREFLANPTACGRIIPSVELRLLEDDGSDAPAGEPGEIAVRSPCVTDGYIGDPQASERALSDGWLRTGDIGAMDQEKRLHVVDRKTNMVISGGENIYCAEVERVLSEHGKVLEVLAYGVPDARLGERLAVTIVPAPGARLTEAEVKDCVAARLAIYKVPREVHFRAMPFARIASGKVDRVGFVRSVPPRPGSAAGRDSQASAAGPGAGEVGLE